ncbi:MAG: CAP domain-containing protein, partial [Solirubrobacteraceae bacterium]
YRGTRGACSVGETIAWGTDALATPAELVRSFIDSSGHRAILLDGRYRDIGIGLALGAPTDMPGDGATLTLDFGRR